VPSNILDRSGLPCAPRKDADVQDGSGTRSDFETEVAGRFGILPNFFR
jgi:hypothetical protein